MSTSDFSIALRVRHPSIDPREISRQIGFEPHHSWRAGDTRRPVAGEAAAGAYRETYWVGLLPIRELPLLPLPASSEPQTTIFFTLLRMRRAEAFWRRISDEGGTIECLVEVHGAEGFRIDLSQALLALLVHLRITLSVESHAAIRAAA
jgi:hypothetical protein